MPKEWDVKYMCWNGMSSSKMDREAISIYMKKEH